MFFTYSVSQLLFLAVVASVNSSIFYVNQFNSAWIKLCDQHKLEVKATQCPVGVSLSQARPVNCVCVHGLWALKHNTNEHILLFGQGHCFDLNNALVQDLTYLGLTPTEPFETSDFIHENSGFRKIGSGIAVSENPAQLIRINPKSDLSLTLRNDLLVCLPSKTDLRFRNELEPTLELNEELIDHEVLIYELNFGVQALNSWGIADSVKHSKGQGKDNVVQILPGEYYIWNRNKSGYYVGKASRKCKLGCKPSLISLINQKTHARAKRSQNNFADPIPESYVQLGLTNDQRQKLINEETERLIVANYAFIFKLMQGPKVASVREWRIFQKVKDIFEAYCPQNEISQFVLNSMVRMFRYLLAYSRDRFARGISPRYKNKTVKILKTLTKCLEGATPTKIYFSGRIDCTNYNFGSVTGDECTCTTYPTQFVLSNSENLTLTPGNNLPENLRFRLPNDSDYSSDHGLDFPIETAWKMIMLVHYKCNSYFTSTPMDVSYIQMSLEKLFNDAVQYRWNHPGNSFRAYQRAFSAYDLNKFALATDACVGVAKERADYPKWLQRPGTRDREIVVRSKRSLKYEPHETIELKRFGNGQAHCLT